MSNTRVELLEEMLAFMDYNQASIEAALELCTRRYNTAVSKMEKSRIQREWMEELGYNRFGERIPNYFYWIYEHHVGLLYTINTKAELQPFLLAGQRAWVVNKLLKERENENISTSDQGLQREDSEATYTDAPAGSVQWPASSATSSS